MKVNLYPIVICITFTLLSPFSQAQRAYPNWMTVGSTKLSFLWFDIYEAELSTNTGKFDKDGSFKLTLTYLRDFKAQDLITETFKQMPKNFSNEQRSRWQSALQNMWPNVREQDQISFIKDEQNVSHFFFNQQYVGKIEDPEFSHNFADIWLGATSSYPTLASQLKGERQ